MNMLKLFKPKSKEQKFWNWIEKNIDHIINITSGGDPFFYKATRELQKYNPELVFEICGNEIVISADGNKDYFKDVIKLCTSAPKNEKYIITPFRQPKGFVPIEFNGIKIKPEDVFFKYEYRNGFYDLEIYHKDYKEELINSIGGAIFLILDHGIGEFAVETKIGAINFYTLINENGLKPISFLKELVETSSESEA